MHDANRTPQVLRSAARARRIAPDSYLSDAGTAPDCYDDFLFRTSGPLLREPSARARAARRRVAG